MRPVPKDNDHGNGVHLITKRLWIRRERYQIKSNGKRNDDIDATKIKRELNWQPQFTLKDIVASSWQGIGGS